MLDQGHLDKWGRAAQCALNDAQLLCTHVPKLSAGMVVLPPARWGTQPFQCARLTSQVRAACPDVWKAPSHCILWHLPRHPLHLPALHFPLPLTLQAQEGGVGGVHPHGSLAGEPSSTPVVASASRRRRAAGAALHPAAPLQKPSIRVGGEMGQCKQEVGRARLTSGSGRQREGWGHAPGMPGSTNVNVWQNRLASRQHVV